MKPLKGLKITQTCGAAIIYYDCGFAQDCFKHAPIESGLEIGANASHDPPARKVQQSHHAV
jgi:hypothetical protein